MNLRKWLIFLLGYTLMMTGVLACAKAERTMWKTERVITDTGRFIKERAHITDEFENPEDPLYWQMWQDSQGGG